MRHKTFRDAVATILQDEPEGLSTLQIRDRLFERGVLWVPMHSGFGGALRKVPGVFAVGTMKTGALTLREQKVWCIDIDRYKEWREGKC
jgi:hypothetical protein